MTTILSGAGNGAGPSVALNFHNGPRKLIVVISGTFGGSTASLEISPDGGTTFVTLYSDINSIAISTTSAKTFSFWASNDYIVRGSVTGGTANSVNMVIL